MKLNIWLKMWLNNYMKSTIKLKTYLKYDYIIEKHINPHLGDYDLDELNVTLLQNFFNTKIQVGNLITASRLANSSILGIYSLLKNAIKDANNYEITKVNNLSKIKLPAKCEKEIDIFDKSEQKKIVSYCLTSNKNNYLGIIICLYTGIRLGELLALKWSDIDFNNGTLKISRTVFTISQNGQDYAYINPPKTKNSNRLIPLPDSLLETLKRNYSQRNSDYIISTKAGKMVENRSYQKTFQSIQKKLAIRPRNFHTLRHTFATMALECGMDVKALSEILGHKSPVITLNRYSHSLFNYKMNMMNQIGKSLL